MNVRMKVSRNCLTYLGTVVAVENDGDAVVLGHQSDVLSSRDGPEDGGFLPGVLDALPREEGSTSIGKLNDDGGVDVPGSLQDGIDGGGRGAVKC